MKRQLKKAISTTAAAVAIIGAMVAVCTADDSAHEMTLRLAGVAAFAIGTGLWTVFGEDNDGKEAAR